MSVSQVGKRQAQRHSCSVRAQLQFRGGRPPVECSIIDYSATGARIKLSDDIDLPARFALHIPSRSDTKNVILRWRGEGECGVEYSSANTQISDDIIDLSDRVEALDRRVVALEHGGVAPRELLEAHGGDAGAPQALEPSVSLSELRDRIDEVESVAADAAAALEKRLERRIAAIAYEAPHAPAPPGAPSLEARINDLEARLKEARAPQAPVAANAAGLQEFAARLAAVEDFARNRPAGETPAQVAPVVASPLAPEPYDDSALQARVVDLETQLGRLKSRVGTFDPARNDAFDRRLAALEASESAHANFSEDIAAALSRIDALEQGAHSASVAASVPEPAPELDGLFARVSNIEVDMLNLKFGKASGENVEYEARLARLEAQNADIQSALKDVLSFLMRKSA